MSAGISLLNGFVVSIFGSVLSAFFCGALRSRRNIRIFCCGMVALSILQGGITFVWGNELLRHVYPLAVHLPLILMLMFLTRKCLLSTISVLVAYLCCQLRRWMALLITALFDGGAIMQAAAELAVTLPLLVMLLRFAGPAFQRISSYSVKIQLQYSVLPALYYVFDYAAVVYTDLLASGSPVVLEFMPFVCCLTYLIFMSYNAAAEQELSRLEQLQNILDLQVDQSAREIRVLRESQELARRYRHDLRHHLQYVSACIANGQTVQAQDYISGICHEIESQKVQTYCENEAVNLILSSFAARARKNGISVNVYGTLSSGIAVSDSDLCIILSNALENAIHACRPFAGNGISCTIEVQFYEREGKFFLQVTNPCGEDVCFENGIPVSYQSGHGIGVQSICAIVQRYSGVHSFLVRDGRFILRLAI